LLAWYDRHRRVLPWRAAAGETPDPYRVWLSEIMLQQTTVRAVAPYFARFVERWPHVHALAAASLEDVLRLWAGLGYYARARNLHACAQAVATRPGGQFPATEAELATLPGIGAYTAAAIAAIAFDVPAAAVDGNVERVVTRLFALERELPGAKPAIRELTQSLVPAARSGDFAQALMDLGATICLARNPRCAICPLADACPSRGTRDEPARRQSRFEGSFRQRRASTLRLVADRPRRASRLDAEVVRALERDGLVVVERGIARLPT
jgi:A/G-specific adenine glycosylase